MEILFNRIRKGAQSTLSEVFVDGVFFDMYVLEDLDRGLDDSWTLEEIKKVKVKSETAIPTGRYQVKINYSPRFKRQLPLLYNVKGFSGIRIHSGNTHLHTEGCPLPGQYWNKVGDDYCVYYSRNAANKLQDAMQEALDDGEEVWIELRPIEKNNKFVTYSLPRW